MSKFKVGDKVKLGKGCITHGEGVLFIDSDGDLGPYIEDYKPKTPCTIEEHWEKVEEELPKANIYRTLMNQTIDNMYWSNASLRYPFYGMDWGYENKSTNNTMQKLTSTLKRVLSKDLQAQYKAGLRNGDIALTEKGKNELLELLAEKHKTELTKVANEIIADEEE